VRQLALQLSTQRENYLPLSGQTSHLTALFYAAFKLLANTVNKKVVSQPKRLKERNSEIVKGLPS
jgi:hypothetical protein